MKTDTFDLKQVKLEVIRYLIKSKPGLKNDQYAKILGISDRHLYRLRVKYKIKIKK